MINPLTPRASRLKTEFDLFRDRVGFYLRAERGRCSQLARDIGVRRQTVWRWFYNRWSNIPGWAAVAVNVWYYQHLPREKDQELRELQKDGLLCPPIRRQTVSPQADNPLLLEVA
jgi:hypothetical protein